MNDFINPEFDPYEAIKQCQHNILEIAKATQHGTDIMRDLANKYNHQQQVIEQLMFHNRKLQRELQQLREQKQP